MKLHTYRLPLEPSKLFPRRCRNGLCEWPTSGNKAHLTGIDHKKGDAIGGCPPVCAGILWEPSGNAKKTKGLLLLI